MSTSPETVKAIKYSYQRMINARTKLKNYCANLEFADFAPNFTQTYPDGRVETLQAPRQECESYELLK